MPRGKSSGHRALAHLLATHSTAIPKQAKEPIFSSELKSQGVIFVICSFYLSSCNEIHFFRHEYLLHFTSFDDILWLKETDSTECEIVLSPFVIDELDKKRLALQR
jgi:hypothetical protein